MLSTFVKPQISKLPFLNFNKRYINTLNLSYDLYKSENSQGNIIILHGLFGSKQNWRSLSKAISQNVSQNVYTIDLRNHGDSPHSESMEYSELSADIIKVIEDTNINENITLIGHSMGGRVAMNLVLEQQYKKIGNKINKLIVVDVGPYPMDIGTSFNHYIQQMKKIEAKKINKQSEADAILNENGITDINIRQFLLTNFKKQTNGTYKFRNPLLVLENQLPRLTKLDEKLLQQKCNMKTLFIAGSKSNYLPQGSYEKLNQLFVNCELKYLDAGHWVHSQKPKEFLDLVTKFVKA
ncbi:alpha/beta-hydrolase [Neoconidiobolus thromboides FSU 785]|nr:alpha/beta-hydrolase [Neoconidiobolus thromboides FSU 785]